MTDGIAWQHYWQHIIISTWQQHLKAFHARVLACQKQISVTLEVSHAGDLDTMLCFLMHQLGRACNAWHWDCRAAGPADGAWPCQ